MRDINRHTLVAACSLAILIVTASASAQSRRIDSGSAVMQRFAFYWETQLNPPTPPLADGSFYGAYYTTAPNLVHRMLLDRVKRVYFGYTVQIEPQPERNTFRLVFQPLTITPAILGVLGNDSSGWTALPSARSDRLVFDPTGVKFPAPQIIRSGDVLELSLLSNISSGQKLTEYVTVQEPPRSPSFAEPDRKPREFSFASGPPHDLAVSDIALHLQEPRVFINGRFEESSGRMMSEETGAAVWIYIPKRGRFVLSAVPNQKAGFRRAGEIRGNSLSFSVGGTTYNVTCGARIAPGTGAYNLYVLQQPDWRPNYPNANLDVITIGAADRAEYLLAK